MPLLSSPKRGMRHLPEPEMKRDSKIFWRDIFRQVSDRQIELEAGKERMMLL